MKKGSVPGPSEIRTFLTDLRTELDAAASMGIESETGRRLGVWKISPAEILRMREIECNFSREMAVYDKPTTGDVHTLLTIKAERMDAALDPVVHDGKIDDSILEAERAIPRLARIKTHGFTVAKLFETVFPDPIWIIPGLLTVGAYLLAGSPKLGKSWLALALGVAVGFGGRALGFFEVEKRGVLYLALEDTPRRLKNRLEKIRAPINTQMDLHTTWESGEAGIADLDAYLIEHPETKLVLIDTLARFRTESSGDDKYASDYRAVASIKTLADKHEACILLVHHTRKAPSEDQLDMVSGTNGLNGAADGTLTLTRIRGESDACLFVTGRDVEEQSLALRFDRDAGQWSLIGDAAEFAQSKERREILAAVPLEPESRKTKDIVLSTGKKNAAVSRLLEKLEREGLVFSPSYGEWSRRDTGKTGKTVKVNEVVKEEVLPVLPLLPGNTGNKSTPVKEGELEIY